jgi:hypothetical protein
MLAGYVSQNINRCANVGSSIAVIFVDCSLGNVSWLVIGMYLDVNGLSLEIQTEHNEFDFRECRPSYVSPPLSLPSAINVLNEACTRLEREKDNGSAEYQSLCGLLRSCHRGLFVGLYCYSVQQMATVVRIPEFQLEILFDFRDTSKRFTVPVHKPLASYSSIIRYLC